MSKRKKKRRLHRNEILWRDAGCVVWNVFVLIIKEMNAKYFDNISNKDVIVLFFLINCFQVNCEKIHLEFCDNKNNNKDIKNLMLGPDFINLSKQYTRTSQ